MGLDSKLTREKLIDLLYKKVSEIDIITFDIVEFYVDGVKVIEACEKTHSPHPYMVHKYTLLRHALQDLGGEEILDEITQGDRGQGSKTQDRANL
jgi:hypothetical protein